MGRPVSAQVPEQAGGSMIYTQVWHIGSGVSAWQSGGEIIVQNAEISLARGTRGALQKESPLEKAQRGWQISGEVVVPAARSWLGTPSAVPPLVSHRLRRVDQSIRFAAERAFHGCNSPAVCHAIGEVPGVGDDGAQVGILRGPTQAVAELLTAGHQTGGIAFAARTHDVGYFPAGDFLHRADHLHDAAAGAGADVELVARAAVQQVLDGQDVRLREIADVDVIADAGAVRGGVVVAENGDGLAGFDGTEDERDQVRLGRVLFAERGFGIGAGGVEVAQADAGELMNLVEPAN